MNFEDYKKKISEVDERKSPLGLSFEAELFQGASWFIALSDFGDLPKESVPTEKIETINALKEFAEKSKTPVKFPGGEIALKQKTDAVAENSLERVSSNLGEYVQKISRCDLCLQSEKNCPVSEISEETKVPIKVLFVGDYPREKSEMKFCFSGEKGDLLSKMIKAMKLEKDEFAHTLSVKCFGANEKEQNLVVCLSCLLEEIFLLKPQIVVTLGAFSTNLLLGKKEKLGSLHGQSFERKIKIASGQEHAYTVIPIFHPEYLIINPKMKKTAWEDLQKVMKLIGKL